MIHSICPRDNCLHEECSPHLLWEQHHHPNFSPNPVPRKSQQLGCHWNRKSQKNLLKICQNRLQFFGPLHEATPSPSCRCRPVKFYVWYVILESRIAWERWRVWEILIWPRSSHLHFFSSQRFLAAGIFFLKSTAAAFFDRWLSSSSAKIVPTSCYLF